MGGKRVGGHGVDADFVDYLVFIERNEVFGGVLAAEFFGKMVGIGGADDKGGNGAAVTKDSFADVFVYLVDVLVGEYQAKTIFAGFGENFDK